MVAQRKKFSSQASIELLEQMQKIARTEGRHFQAVLEDAMTCYIESRSQEKIRPAFMAHVQASMERNRRLAELLADS